MEKCLIKLIIKTSNELDHLIFCNVNWNVCQLKEHISKVHPKKPKSTCQNLFYYGKLLDNSEYLKNIFHNYQNNDQIYIIHLIEKINLNKFMRNMEQESNDAFNVSSSLKDVNLMYEKITSSRLPFLQYNYLNENQVVWIQKAYEHYLSHYMQLLTMSGYQLSTTPCCSQAYKICWNNINNNTMQNNLFNNEDQHQQLILYRGDVTNFNNHNNNNNNNNNVHNNNIDNGEDGIILGNNRDWLDNFYMFSRIIILFSIVYFYSSPLRFIIVTFSGFLIYLYHHGFFNTQQFVLTDNNNAQVENNNQIEQNEQNRMPEILRLQQNLLANEHESLIRIYENNEIIGRRPGVLSLTWIFLSSFLASLVPDQPNIA